MARQISLLFAAPRTITLQDSYIPEPGSGQVLLEAAVSAISPGTEMLFYRGQVPDSMAVDDTIEALAGAFSYPLSYGYALVGTVTAVGPGVNKGWLGRRAFVFAAHQSHIVCKVEDLLPLPPDLTVENAVLLPFMETAVSFLMDSQPMIGEKVIIFGQGIIGLLVTALLADYPLSGLLTVDPYPMRREWSLRLGADQALDPAAPDFEPQLTAAFRGDGRYHGADLVFELSGDPLALDQAIAWSGFDARVLIGSWYGSKRAAIDLGGHFHRSQIKLVSSQVSHIAPRLRGRFDKARRMQVAWRMLERHRPQALITHRFPITRAAEAYRLLDEDPETAVQVIFEYDTDY